MTSYSKIPPQQFRIKVEEDDDSDSSGYVISSEKDIRNQRTNMKRGAGADHRDFDSPQKKRMRDHSHRLRILIPSRVAGSIIGKGGSNISQLRSEFHATISVPDCPGPERVITIAADDHDTTFNVLRKVLTIIEDPSNRDSNRGGNSSGDKIEVRVLFHQSQVGCIIGKAGAKIKELRAATSAQIKVYGICCPGSTDRVVAVSGSPEVALNAITQILFALSNDTSNRNINDQEHYEYDPHNYDESQAFDYGGYGDARGGPSFGGGGGGGGDRFSRPMGGGGGSGGPNRFMGGSSGHNNSMGGGMRGGGRGGGRGGRGGGAGGRGGGHQGRPDDFNPNQNFNDEESETQQVTIPNEYAGAIIGKGGSRIRRIRAESCANITIDEALPGQSDRIITISGAPGQIRMAQFLLQKSVKEHGAKQQGGQGQFFD